MTTYNYTRKNLLDNPERYFYSQFLGTEFLSSYFTIRQKNLLDLVVDDDEQKFESSYHKRKFLEPFAKEKNYNYVDDHINTNDLFLKNLLEKKTDNFEHIFERFIQKFEVSKKLNDQYLVKSLKPIGENRNILVYNLFGCMLIKYYNNTKNLRYLNSLIKLSDLLCSVKDKKFQNYRHGTAYIILMEIHFVKNLLNENGIVL